ncbi:ThuA domain-containing protein [Puniceicoccaceae bacterium K14]|nr:ThuA domain-containing protein [Puniceicoccaceae bacterium K14]
MREPAREDDDYAVSWVQSVGKGRIFYSSLGHRHDIFTNSLILNHYLAGIQFAVGDLEADTTPSSQIEVPNLKK